MAGIPSADSGPACRPGSNDTRPCNELWGGGGPASYRHYLSCYCLSVCRLANKRTLFVTDILAAYVLHLALARGLITCYQHQFHVHRNGRSRVDKNCGS
ncbi:hypothetical protein J6590_017893 [Homalodisca vitripennis]|nr:hypothetical protein J6590_017893 [Homalodisca vitripennis]